MERTVTIGLIQMASSLDIQANLEKTIGYIEQAAGQGAQIICTQELFKSRYFCQTINSENFNLAEPVDEDSSTVKLFQRWLEILKSY